ncbi:macro domain-containing protein [Nanoarchaeota archaeon]
MKVTVKQDSIVKQDVDAIVNPANSFGMMGGGVAKVIKKVGGAKIEEEAIENAPVELGHALATTPGELKCNAIIHAPTMRDPAQKTDILCVEQATRAAVELADELGFKKIAMPGMGTGVGGVPHKDVAEKMIEVIFSFESESLKEVLLVDIDEKMVKEWEKLV